MTVKVGINGSGRNSRNIIRTAYVRRKAGDSSIEIVALNDQYITINQLVHLLQYDSTQGKFPASVSANGDDQIIIGDNEFVIHLTHFNIPSDIPWSKHNVQVVIETTNCNVELSQTEHHMKGTVKKVIVVLFSPDVPKIVAGVNDSKYDPVKYHTLCSGSPTTICTTLMARILDSKFGLEAGLLTAVHSATACQKTVDGFADNAVRDGRAVSQNIIPAPTNMAKCISNVMPEMEGRISGMAYRVPTVNVSCADFNVNLKTDTTLEELIKAFDDAAASDQFKGLVSVSREELVSSDYIGSATSCTIDALACLQITPRFFKIIAWYDNESGYALRILELVKLLEKRGLNSKERIKQRPSFHGIS